MYASDGVVALSRPPFGPALSVRCSMCNCLQNPSTSRRWSLYEASRKSRICEAIFQAEVSFVNGVNQTNNSTTFAVACVGATQCERLRMLFSRGVLFSLRIPSQGAFQLRNLMPIPLGTLS